MDARAPSFFSPSLPTRVARSPLPLPLATLVLCFLGICAHFSVPSGMVACADKILRERTAVDVLLSVLLPYSCWCPFCLFALLPNLCCRSYWLALVGRSCVQKTQDSGSVTGVPHVRASQRGKSTAHATHTLSCLRPSSSPAACSSCLFFLSFVWRWVCGGVFIFVRRSSFILSVALKPARQRSCSTY